MSTAPHEPQASDPANAALRILALETSGRAGSVAIGEARAVIDQQSLSSTARHAADLLPAIDMLMRRHGWQPRELAQCYVSIGPGSFTGLRVAVTFARHLAL